MDLRRLQTVSNYFLLSLALADLLIGLISMPLYTLYLLLNYWPLGPLMCDIWLAIDYLNSNAAVLNMLIISFDRYFSVTRPLTYRAKRTTKHACLMISCAWILSLTIWTPAIFTYPYYWGRTVQGTDKCEIEFVKANTYLTFVTAILAFYIPVIIMIYLYWRIWLETKKRYRDLTTLFLVSGVGAAAPARLNRPPAHSTSGQQSIPAIAGGGSGPSTSLGQTKAVGQFGQKLSPLALRQTPSPAHGLGCNQNGKIAGGGNFPCRLGQQKPTPTTSGCDISTSHKGPKQLEQVDAGALLERGAGQVGTKLMHNQPVKCRCPACPRIIKRTRRSSPKHQHHSRRTLPHCELVQQSGDCLRCRQLREELIQQQEESIGLDSHQPVVCRLCPAKRSALCNCDNNCYTLRWNSSGRKQRNSPPVGAAKEETASRQRRREPQPEGADEEAEEEEEEEEVVAPAGVVPGEHSAAGQRHLETKRRHHHHHHNHHHQASRGHHHHHHHSSGGAARQKATSGRGHYDRQSNSPRPQPVQWDGSPAKTETEMDKDKQGKLALISNSYQMLSNNTKSHPCASIKVHPTSTGSGSALNSGEPEQDKKQPTNPDESSPNGQPLEGGASSKSNDGQQEINSNETIQSKPERGQVEMKDTAISPIIFPSSPLSVDIEDEDDKDFETRIISMGNKFRFVSEHQPPAPEVANSTRRDVPSAKTRPIGRHQTTRLTCRHCELVNLSKLPPCCSQAMTIHDNDCKVCNPNFAKLHPVGSKPQLLDCQQCSRQQVANSTGSRAKEAEEAADQARLPILSALKQPSGETIRAEVQTSSDNQDSFRGGGEGGKGKKKAKKFSQKLTFSDILVSEQRGNTSKDNSRLNVQFSSGRNAAQFDRSNYPIDDEDITHQAGNNQQQLPISLTGRLINNLKRFICGEPSENNSNGFSSMQEVDNRTMLKALCCGSAIKINTNANSSGATNKKRLSSNGSISNNKNSSSEESEPNNNNNSRNGNNNNNNQSSTKPSYSSHHPIQPKSERKAAKTLSTLLLVFIVTWLPYNVLVLIKTLSGGEDQVPEKVWNFSYYLCYINSTINPLCYALCNAQFRRTYMRILQCKLSNEHNTTRRLVPLQSSTTWNKDLRNITVSDTTSNPTTQASTTTTNNGR